MPSHFILPSISQICKYFARIYTFIMLLLKFILFYHVGNTKLATMLVENYINSY